VASYGSITDYVLGNYLWRYAGPGSVEDLPCGGHNVSLTLETVPPIAASVVGADLFLRLRLRTGTAAGGEYVPGFSETITLSVTGGDAFAALNGINETIALSLNPGVVIGDASVSGVDLAFGLTLDVGDALNAGRGGINETITLSLAAGAAINDTGEPGIGDAYGGGYFAGYISHTADGVATHRLIVAPAATGGSGTGYTITTNRQWKTASSFTAGTGSTFDGAANTAAIVTAGINSHPAAKFCTELTIGGLSDWYLPALYELDIAYENLKPTTASNSTSNGINPYSVPKRNSNRTAGTPAQTAVSEFQSSGLEDFMTSLAHWSSTQDAAVAANARHVIFSTGNLNSGGKTLTFFATRAFRREAI
jgi:hypothetical protein